MKNIIKFLFSALFLSALVTSCKKEENKVYLEGATNPVLVASSTATMVLDPFNAVNRTAITFSWTNPDYKFNTGVSSQDVTYILQVDTTGSNFTNPNIQEASIAKELSYKPTVKEFNGFFNKMGLKYDMPHNIEFRIKATLAGGLAAPVYSNVIKIKITPYLDVAVPVPVLGTLWVVGDAFVGGWNNPLAAPYITTQKFTQISVTKYELTVDFKGGGGYKLIQEMGQWGSQYHALDGTVFSDGSFEKKDSDPQFPGATVAGKYKITIDFITGKYKVEKI
jgi:hypothetical protein